MRRSLEAAADAWGAVQRYSAAVIMIVMTALYGFNVLVRTVLPQFAATFAWIEEGARYMLVWVVFLAAGVALETGRQILIDMWWEKLGQRSRRVLFATIDVAGVLFSIYMAVLALQLSLFVARTGQISPTLGISAYILYVAPVVGFASLALGFMLRLFSLRDARRNPPKAEWLGGVAP
jgi:TRAP-type C4-dicarboxylate transport system permease small subunit